MLQDLLRLALWVLGLLCVVILVALVSGLLGLVWWGVRWGVDMDSDIRRDAGVLRTQVAELPTAQTPLSTSVTVLATQAAPLQTQVAVLQAASPGTPSEAATVVAQAVPLQTQVVALSTQVAAPDYALLKDRVTLQKDVFQSETDNRIKIWTGFTQALGVGALLSAATILLAWRTFLAAQTQSEVAQKDRIEASIREAFKLLGDTRDKDGKPVPNLEVRVGSVFSLERLAKDSPRDHWRIMEMLTAYVRVNSPWPCPDPTDTAGASPTVAPPTVAPPADLAVAAPAGHKGGSAPEGTPPKPRIDAVQAVLWVLGRRERPTKKEFQERGPLHLCDIDLRGTGFWTPREKGGATCSASTSRGLTYRASTSGTLA